MKKYNTLYNTRRKALRQAPRKVNMINLNVIIIVIVINNVIIIIIIILLLLLKVFDTLPDASFVSSVSVRSAIVNGSLRLIISV